MNNASLELGGTNWAEKDASLLGYTVSDDSGRFFPQEFTFSRGSNLAATRIGKTGLIEKGRENLLVQSNQFDTTWVTTLTSVTSGHSGYDGSNNAWKLIQNTNTGYHYISQGITNTSVQTFSIYAKAGEYSSISFFIKNLAGNSAASTFNLSTGTFVSNTHNATAESVGNGWYRISLLTKPNGYQTLNTYVNQTTQRSEAGDGTSGIYIQDAQLELGLAASPYIPTTTTTAQAGVLENTPRLNYTTGVANPYLLLEPSRGNLIGNSEYFSGTGWALYRLSNLCNQVESPEGLINASELIENAENNTHVARYETASYSGSHTISFFAKRNRGTRNLGFTTSASTSQYITFDLSNGTIDTELDTIASDIEDFGNGWYKCWASFNLSSSTNFDLRLVESGHTGSPATSIYLGDGTSSIYIYGAQLEEGSYPTSYIPTYSASATRAGDSCYKTGISSLIGQTEGTVFIDINNRLLSPYPNEYVFRITGTGGDQLWLRKESGANNFTARLTVGGSNVWTISIAPPNGLTKIAIAYKSGDSVVYLNGTQVNASSATFSGNVLENFYFSASSTGNTELKLNQSLLYKERLTNAELITLTTI